MLAWKTSHLFDEPIVSRTILLVGFLVGISCFTFYYAQQLTVAHYDAKAHLVVSRRIVDSLEPGYSQIGVSWLPLLHLIYLPFVVFDFQYRSGLIPSLISVSAFALSGWLAYRISYRITGSVAAGIYAAVVLLANPNLQYLQSCPLTEPFFMALLLLGMDRLIWWRESDHSSLPLSAAIWTSLAGLCRYEGWYFFAGVLLLLVHDFRTRYVPRRKALLAGIVYSTFFLIPAALHFGYISFRLGDNFFHRIMGGNADPYVTHKRIFLSVIYHLGELSQMAAILPLLLAATGLLIFLVQHRKWRHGIPLLLLWVPSLINISALYWGLIYRLRYSALLLPAVAIFGSIVIASSKGVRKRAFLLMSVSAMIMPFVSWCFRDSGGGNAFAPGPGILLLPAGALVLFLIAGAKKWYEWTLLSLCVLGMHIPALNKEHRPIMAETFEHNFIEQERHEVIQYIRSFYDGGRILIDMGRLAPLIYDSGLPVREFVYNEGLGIMWRKAVRKPESIVGWLCMQEGDALAQRLKSDPGWLDKYSLEVKTKHFLLYRLKTINRIS
jgi:hypothetical protein